MKEIRRIEWQMTDEGLEENFRDDCWYDGPVELAGGGPSPQQTAAATAQTNLSNQLGATAASQEAFKEEQQRKTQPFYSNLMTNGPSYFNAGTDYASGINAQAYAPARAALLKRLGGNTGLPSGSREQMLTDFDSNRARGFDSTLMTALQDRQASQERGAAGLMGEAQEANPMSYYQGALGGNSSIMNANLRKPGIAGTVGSLVGGGIAAFA